MSVTVELITRREKVSFFSITRLMLSFTSDLSEFNVNVMTRNNGAHLRSRHDPGIQKWPFFLFLTPEKKINSMELMIYSLKMTVSLKWKKFLGSGTKRKVISESLGHKENVGVLRCFGSWHWHWILIDPMCKSCKPTLFDQAKKSWNFKQWFFALSY